MRRTFHFSSSDFLPAEKSDFMWDLYHHLPSWVGEFSFFLFLIDDWSHKYNIVGVFFSKAIQLLSITARILKNH